MSKIALLLSVATAITAIALPQPSAGASTQYTDTFDDLATSIVTAQLFPVGLYHDLAYKGPVVFRPIVETSVVPHSGAQEAAAGATLDLLQVGVVTLHPFVTITRSEAIKSFDLQSFWFGLGTGTQASVSAAQLGTIYVIGYSVNGVQVNERFDYVPAGAVNAPTVQAVLPSSFKNLQNVTIAVLFSAPVTERTTLFLDDTKHLNHY
ncbi:hypothetical protein K461DRAFT_310076 [Myriangium duriaei CBS 260.36]|uniref:Uncharacterized protein n=1 Tax=Myriangium duriaei CBS 260.36 TaxID=1168546 RepID=A0A9P4JCK2_9PEZI|nr:hypothetical protein K461DRAFT_310076 [Myriangium duriaei CBS 260.36]